MVLPNSRPSRLWHQTSFLITHATRSSMQTKHSHSFIIRKFLLPKRENGNVRMKVHSGLYSKGTLFILEDGRKILKTDASTVNTHVIAQIKRRHAKEKQIFLSGRTKPSPGAPSCVCSQLRNGTQKNGTQSEDGNKKRVSH